MLYELFQNLQITYGSGKKVAENDAKHMAAENQKMDQNGKKKNT